MGALYGLRGRRVVYTEATPFGALPEAACRLAEERLAQFDFDVVEIWDGVVLVCRVSRPKAG